MDEGKYSENIEGRVWVGQRSTSMLIKILTTHNLARND